MPRTDPSPQPTAGTAEPDPVRLRRRAEVLRRLARRRRRADPPGPRRDLPPSAV